MIVKHLKSLILNDFDNRIVKEEGISNYQAEKKDITLPGRTLSTVFADNPDTASHVIEEEKNLYKVLYTKRHTEIILCFETSSNPKNIDVAKDALDYFISSYRIVTDDILTLPIDKMSYVFRIYKEGFHVYSQEELKMEKSERLKATRGFHLNIKQVRLPFYNIEGRTFATDPTKNSSALTFFFLNKKSPNHLLEYILKAREELYIHNNFKYSFIESWTAIEIAIVSYLKQIKIDKGISKTKLDSYETEVGISYLINIELPLVHPKAKDADFKDMLGRVDGTRKIRNKLIHDNLSVSKEHAEAALKVAIDLLNLFGYTKY